MLSEKAGYLVALLGGSTAGLLILVSLFCVPIVNGGKSERNVAEFTGVVLAYDNGSSFPEREMKDCPSVNRFILIP